MPLNDRQKLFCLEYLKDLNATRAATRAGYTKKTARQVGSKLLTNLDIAAECERLFKIRQKVVDTSQEQILEDIITVKQRCMQEVAPKLEKDPDGNWIESGEFKFDATAALKACELAGRHLGMFDDKLRVKVEGPKEIAIKYIKSTTKNYDTPANASRTA